MIITAIAQQIRSFFFALGVIGSAAVLSGLLAAFLIIRGGIMTAREYLEVIPSIRARLKIAGKQYDNCGIVYSIGALDYSKERVQTSPENRLEEAGYKLLEERAKLLK